MNIGLKYPVCATYSDATGAAVYTNGFVMAKAITANVTWNLNNEVLYADDDLEMIDNSIIAGNEDIGVSQLPDTIAATLLGHTVTDGELSIGENDVAPYFGHGFYGKIVIDKAVKYRAIWIGKIKYSEPEEALDTKGNSTKYKTPTIKGTIHRDIAGKFTYKKTFDTEAAAIAYLQAKASITAQLAKPVANVASDTYSSTQTVSLSALAGATIYYTVNGTTPSAANGAEYTTAISVAESCALRAIAVKEGSSNSEVATYEYIITE